MYFIAVPASSLILNNSVRTYVFVQNFLPDLKGNSLANFDEIWQAGLSQDLLLYLRKLARGPVVATYEKPPK